MGAASVAFREVGRCHEPETSVFTEPGTAGARGSTSTARINAMRGINDDTQQAESKLISRTSRPWKLPISQTPPAATGLGAGDRIGPGAVVEVPGINPRGSLSSVKRTTTQCPEELHVWLQDPVLPSSPSGA